jgi:hypothetical protein
MPMEFIELNDCFYRNLYNYEYLVTIDIDKVIVPVNAYNWSELIEKIKIFLKSNLSSKLIFYRFFLLILKAITQWNNSYRKIGFLSIFECDNLYRSRSG